MTSQEFIEKFNLPISEFSTPVAYSDEVGFGFIQEHKNNRASSYSIIINNKDTNPVKNLSISVHYGEKTEGGIRLGINNNLYNPVDIVNGDEFTYNTETNKFYFRKKEIKPDDIIFKINKAHNKTSKIISGFIVRSKLWFWRKMLPFIIKVLDLILIAILWVVSGERIKDNIWNRLLSKYHEKEVIKKIEFEPAETMDFFGYKAKRWSVVFYGLLHLIIIFIYINRFPTALNVLLDNSIFILCYVVVSFFITESLFPIILKSLIKLTPKVFGYISFKRVKI